MYIVINKKTKESAIFKDKTLLCEYTGLNTKTILRNEHKKYYERGDFIVYFPQNIQIKSKRGGNRGNFNKYW